MSTTPGSPPKRTPDASNLKPNRLPAPTLFVGPPSRNASQLSMSRAGAAADPSSVKSPPLLQHQRSSALARSAQQHQPGAPSSSLNGNGGSNNNSNKDKDYDAMSPPGRGPNNETAAAAAAPGRPTLDKASTSTIDQRWRAMQSTLNDVELTAASTTRVFGAAHAAALDDLRGAQVALAKAWGRGAEESAASDEALREAGGKGERLAGAAQGLAEERREKTLAGDGAASRARAGTEASEASASTVLSDESMATSRSGEGREGGKGMMEDETALDIQRAGERRAANEAYFKRVDASVQEVVEKLEKVAEAMGGVEAESRSLWSRSEEGEGESGGSDGGDERKG